ncbi:hypothetical protein D9619_011196 [Psilocybe cf. subviscida]|uniref:NACHT domain-containing protein n=1 Tax=Psilocybe cf. subviscida TaxID=2480587 RepID=A0A8H5BJG0_9AGAR|nr:hypothetical protein D9619_011196 [Psilocybe cf. subviscida]
MSSILNKARQNNIHNNTFVTNVKAEPSLDVLHKRVASNAILNAGGRADEARCHPGTREEVIDRIERWGYAQDDQTAPMFWLSGPAGAGKSAIVQTIAERCDERGAPHANFFFFRADISRSNASSLVATLVHQILLLYPSLRDRVAVVLSANPLIFDSVLESQLVQLVVTPLRAIKQSSSSDYCPLILLIDGLDECDSESKRDQQQILHAFDKVLAEHPWSFRLLVASRDESQICSAFNKVSSRCLHLYLDSKYSPENDIRVFVNAQFAQVKKTHSLAYTLDAAWPSLDDVNYIINKSSGQFIYAATVMRFILDCSASPLISLERVKGAARLATKSPFSYLDAIYTYILSQVDDQGTLKDILHSQLLIRELAHPRVLHLTGSSTAPQVSLIMLMELNHEKYTREIVLSCLADLTPISRYNTQDSNLLFHHASFPDYLLDQSRSGDYFVDTAAFSYQILLVIWKHVDDEPHVFITLFAGQYFGFHAMSQLQTLPPGLMDVLASSNSSWSIDRLPLADNSIFTTIYNLCTRDSDVINFRRIIRQWINGFGDRWIEFDSIKHIPFSRRYYQMDRADHSHDAPDEEMDAALCPETDFDHDELALWLNDFLHRVNKQILYSNTAFKQLLKAWISWAVRNDVSCIGLHDLPNAKLYFQMAYADQHWAVTPDGKMAAWCPETDIDRHESALWLNDLLHHIHRETYPRNAKHYKQLLKAWISWAVWNDVSCDGLDDLPSAQRYIWKDMAQKWAVQNFKIGSSKKLQTVSYPSSQLL